MRWIYCRLSVIAVVLVTLAVAGCSKPSSGVKTEIGYMPILPDAQLFVALEDGDIAKAGIDAKLISFQNGPAIVQALASGQLDVAYFGIGPTMVARSKGADIRVVAANIVDQISFVAMGNLAPYFDSGDPSTAFARFKADKGRPAKISTFPVGSVPQTVLSYWLKNTLHDNGDDLQLVYQGASQVQQSLLTGAVDGAAILEPVVSIVQKRRPEARVIASGAQMFKDQPGAVLAVRQSYLEKHPRIVEKLVAAHIKATHELQQNSPQAIDAVSKYVGGGRLPRDVIKTAVAHSASHFVADPHRIIDSTQRMYDFQRQIGTLKAELDVKALFDTTFYDKLDQNAPTD
ncbi:MAG: ABC transporter substrate-binding protein [Salinisphaera sp.]|jgi:NitT/TauT family transport system substrate-binding protein|nr:ABC transporter substrate-binding protein [Salinisphaera sp.]